MSSRVVGCFAAARLRPLAVALVALLFAGSAGALAPAPWVRVLSESDTGCELLLTAPEPEIGPESVRIAGFDAGGEPGLPLVFEQALSIAVPGPAGARLEVFDARDRDLGRVPVEIAPSPVSQAARHAAAEAGKPVVEWEPAEARRLDAVYPSRSVELGGVARLRGRDFVTLHFRPLRYRPDGGASFVGSVRVRVTFAERPTRRDLGIATSEPMHQVFVNAASAARWNLAAAAVPKSTPHRAPAALPSHRLRVRVPARGVYQLTYAALQAAGVPVARADFDPRTLRLFFDTWKPIVLYADSAPSSWQPGYEPRESAIWVPGEADGGFSATDPEDRVVFYALGAEGYEDLAGTSADSLAYFRHPYDKNVYGWLTWDGDFGLRMQAQDVAAPDSLAAPRVDRVWHREHREQDAAFDAMDDLWYWEEVRATRPVNRSFALDLGGQVSTVGDLHVALGYVDPTGKHVLDVQLNSQAAGRADFFQPPGNRPRRFDFTNLILRGSTDNVLGLSVVQGLDSSRGTYLFEFDVTYVRPLVAPNTTLPASLVLGWSARPASAPAEIYQLGKFGAQAPLVLDVTDAAHPVRLTNPTATGSGATTVWNVLHGRGIGRRSHYMAVGAPTPIEGRDLVLRDVAPLRTRTSAPDMLVVTHESLRAAADRLAAFRRTHWVGGGDPDILVVNTADIYDEFSGGRMDPLAIRNYAKFLYGLDATPRLRFLLLFGDATHDMRQVLSSSAPTLVPTLTPGYLDPRYDRLQSAYAVEDWLAEFETPHNGAVPFPVPDVGIGRLAARSLGEADRLVDKIEAYETTSGFGPWRARLLMVADDECSPINGCGESFHIDNTENLSRLVPRDLDLEKFYLTEYKAVLGQKPQARAAFIRSWSAGCTIVNYQGHGAPRQLADEVLLLSTDIPSLTNGTKLPAFLAVSCTVSEFDDPGRQSMCEDLIASPVGGAIATVGATTPTYVGPNAYYNTQLFDLMFADGPTSHVPLGLVHQMAKRRSPIGTGEFTETYLLLGDPSMALVWPHALVRITSGADSLGTAERAHVEGEIVSPVDSLRIAGFAGSVDVEVLGTDDTSGYRRPPPGPLVIRYDLPGTPLYRGTVPVADGRFAFQFIVPVGAELGNQARLLAYASGATGDAQGARDDLVVRVGTSPDSSLGAPRISLHFPNERTRVKAGTLLTAVIRDENGINIQGTSLRNSIYLDFDHHNDPLNVTPQFRYQAGSDSVGSVAVPIPADLSQGAHTATLIASDNLQNTATQTLDFQVVDEQVVQLVNVLAFPNPFRDWTRFFFEITDPATVELEVFTTSGRRVWSHQQRVEVGSQASIQWDGVDLVEDRVANGTYIFRLRAHPDRHGSPTLEQIGKVVIMR